MTNRLSTRLFRMIERHARVDDALRHEQQRPFASWQRVNELKRVKLRIKDMIQRLMARSAPAQQPARITTR